ncbi:hypothetical protein QE400_002285 [Xanthomonas sacchari]|uniref:hypothetical protein n=1 Tax=Xanthomonas sacchari TaxID=56458 RepID=UPI0020C43D7F|nr:hypothetical protein [Xanthomonas sacchari]MDQ1092872.1 hypothetical protein [Xanthomonas sacchari]
MRTTSVVIVSTLVLGFAAASFSSYAATQTITASASHGNTYNGTASTSVPSTVTCTQASAPGTDGTKCMIQAPGWYGAINQGDSIGTTGAGTVVLNCSGQYDYNSGSLSCAATVEDTVCRQSTTLNSSIKGQRNIVATTPIKAGATVKCTAASGGIYGTTCGVTNPGASMVVLPVGQSIVANGPGTVKMGCNGAYDANSGSLTCSALVTQVCQ